MEESKEHRGHGPLTDKVIGLISFFMSIEEKIYRLKMQTRICLHINKIFKKNKV